MDSSRNRPASGGSADLAIVAALFVAISIWSASTQRTERLYADGQKYQSMAYQFSQSSIPITAPGPFVYRIGTPWLAGSLRPAIERMLPRLDSALEETVGMSGVAPFYVINVAAAATAALFLALYLRAFVASGVVRVLVVTAWMAMWHEPTRFVYFYPVNVDAVFQALLFAALLIIERFRNRSALAGALALAPVVFAGTLVRESMVLAAIAFAIVRIDAARRHRQPIALVELGVPAVAWIAAALVARRIAVADPPYYPWTDVQNMLREKPLFTWVLAWFFTFGPPAIALVASAWRDVVAFARLRPEFPVFIAACAVAAYAGGTDTERILAWAAPPVYVLVALAIRADQPVLARAPWLVVLLVTVQIASSRLLWPIPVGVDDAKRFATLGLNPDGIVAAADKFLVIHNYYSNLWSFFGSRMVHAATLAFDVVLTAGIAFWIERTRRRISAPAVLAGAGMHARSSGRERFS